MHFDAASTKLQQSPVTTNFNNLYFKQGLPFGLSCTCIVAFVFGIVCFDSLPHLSIMLCTPLLRISCLYCLRLRVWFPNSSHIHIHFEPKAWARSLTRKWVCIKWLTVFNTKMRKEYPSAQKFWYFRVYSVYVEGNRCLQSARFEQSRYLGSTFTFAQTSRTKTNLQ